jgi:DNA-directed RNA polymerase specialized sigma24 family protein
MAASSVSETTHLLRAWADGYEFAFDDLIPMVYRELRQLAARCLRNERPEQTLQVSGLIREAAEPVAPDYALKELTRLAPRKARIVGLRFFRGPGMKETAGLAGVSSDTVMRDWRLAKAWLFKEFSAA